MTDEQPTDAPVEDAPVDEAPVDGASVDGASVDGALDDGASVDGALNEGASVDGALDEGASVDGALDEGASVDGALVEGTPAADASGVGDGPTFYRYLTFNAPLSTRRADAILDRLPAAARGDVLDVGCGWGELLLRLVAAVPGCTGTGVDIDRAALSRGRAAAAERGLADRVSFRDVSFRDVSFRDQPDGDGYSPADVVICVGSSHVFGDLTEALVALRGIVRPGGRLLFGEAYWEPHAPGDRSLIWDDVLTLPDLGGLVDLAVDAGFPAAVHRGERPRRVGRVRVRLPRRLRRVAHDAPRPRRGGRRTGQG